MFTSRLEDQGSEVSLEKLMEPVLFICDAEDLELDTLHQLHLPLLC